ncbi:MAG TPA: response regulator [Anaeromyxobacter sp.]|nr:response regulator [Anaeromyxobacter sp.]
MPGVLVVDDSLATAVGVAAQLTRAGYEPVQVATGWAQCRSALDHDAPALVILDVHMAGTSGDILATQLKRDPRCAKTRIVLYSGSNVRDLQALARRCGADGFVQKTSGAPLVPICTRLVPPR